MGNLVRALSHNGGVSICAIDSTEIVREMERIHHTSATASAALGRTLTAASLMGTGLKNRNDSLTLRINGGGSIGSIVAVSDYYGNVRGFCGNPIADLPINEANGKLNVGGIVGTDGTIAVIKDLGMKEPYVGQIPLVSGEIAKDVTSYFAISEQIPTVCALGVLVEKDLSVSAAGGFLIQLLPGALDEEIDLLEKNISNISSVTTMLKEGTDPKGMIERCLAGFEPDILDEYDVGYACQCSEERMFSAIASLGKDDIVDLTRDGEPIEIVCDFCRKKYTFTSEKIKSIIL